MTSARASFACRAHPRSRGENTGRRRASARTRGSSPLTRGKLSSPRFFCASRRLIPAHAGKTPRLGYSLYDGPAHPRSRGENIRPIGLASMAAGSSPLTRGKRRVHRQAAPLRGLIPAHAGKTPARSGRRSSAGAHPRSRGENLAGRVPLRGELGSSPLTRGKRARSHR